MPTTRKANDSGPARTPELDAARARIILDTARDAIISIDDSGLITDFNQAAETMFGYAAKEVLGADVEILMPSPYREEHSGYLGTYHKTGIKKAIGHIRDVEALRADGEVFPIELAVSEARSGDEVCYTAVVREITEYRQAMARLRSEHDFSERLIDTAPVIVLVLDPDGRIGLFNRHMEELSGYTLDEVQGKDWFETFLPERDRTTIRKLFGRAISDLPIVGNENVIVTRDGRECPIEWYSTTLRDDGGEIAGILSVGRDVSERKQNEKRLRELERESQERHRLADLGAITAKIVHDVGNPLSALSMQTQLLRRRAIRDQAGAGVIEPADKILMTIDRLTNLLSEFSEFARGQRLALAQIDLKKELREQVGLWQPLAEKHRAEILLETDGEIPEIAADRDKLQRVFENLIKNAIEAVDGGPGTVRIGIDVPNPERVRVRIADSGPGVAADIDPFHLFETTKQGGTGVGLAVVKEIVLAHGGGIDFANQESGGAVFQVVLPIRRSRTDDIGDSTD